MSGKTGHVMTLSNSIIGVGILAMPFCFQKCGIILSVFLLIMSNFITRISCYYLVKSSILCRRKSFEIMAFHAFGSHGKLIVELSIIGFLMGTCVTYFVVLGDLGPQMAAKIIGIEHTETLRTWTMVLVTVFCVIPMGLLRNVESLAAVCTASIGFYFCLVVKVMADSHNHFSVGDWINYVEYWKPSGVLQCLPIISMALFCQLQLFEVFETVQNVSLDKMYGIVKSATSICTGVYILVGFFGYISYCTQEFSGNILLQFPPSFTNDIIKIGFVLSIAFSFPLVIFPCRVSVYSLLYRRGHADVAHYIPEHRFRFITIALVLLGLVIGIMIPSVELVIGLVGSTIGVAICVMFPASCFIKISKKDSTEKLLAQMLLVFGFFLMVLGTYANLVAIEEKTSGTIYTDPKLLKHNPNEIKNLTVQAAEMETKTEKLFPKNVELKPPIIEPNKETKQHALKKVIITLPVNNQIENRKDADINKDAIQREDLEMAIEAKTEPIVKKKFDETKELLKEQVDEIKNELEKRNQETQKLVMEKFDKIVEKLEHKENPPVPKKEKIDKENQNIKVIPKETEKKVTVLENIEKIDKIQEKQPNELKTEQQRTEPNHIIVEEKVIKKVEEIVEKVEKIEQTQQEAKQKEDNLPPPVKQPHEKVLENIEKIAERIDKIQKDQQKEELAQAIDRKVADRIIHIAENIKPNEEIQKTTIIIDKTAYVTHHQDPNVNLAKEDEAAHKLVLQKIEEIVEKVEKIEQHQEKEMQHKQQEIEHKPANVDETDNLVLKKIQAIDDKLEKIEQKQKMADDSVAKLNEKNTGIQQTPIKTDLENKNIIPEKPNLIKNPVVELIIEKKVEFLNKTKTDPNVQNERKIMPPLPLVRNATMNENNPKNIPVEMDAKNVAKIEQIPNVERKSIPDKQLEIESPDENIIAIRRDLLAVNSSKLSSKDKATYSTPPNEPIKNIETIRVKRDINFVNCTNMNAINRQLCHSNYTNQQEEPTINIQIVKKLDTAATLLDGNVILPDFDVKMIGRELKSINENVTDLSADTVGIINMPSKKAGG